MTNLADKIKGDTQLTKDLEKFLRPQLRKYTKYLQLPKAERHSSEFKVIQLDRINSYLHSSQLLSIDRDEEFLYLEDELEAIEPVGYYRRFYLPKTMDIDNLREWLEKSKNNFLKRHKNIEGVNAFYAGVPTREGFIQPLIEGKALTYIGEANISPWTVALVKSSYKTGFYATPTVFMLLKAFLSLSGSLLNDLEMLDVTASNFKDDKLNKECKQSELVNIPIFTDMIYTPLLGRSPKNIASIFNNFLRKVGTDVACDKTDDENLDLDF